MLQEPCVHGESINDSEDYAIPSKSFARLATTSGSGVRSEGARLPPLASCITSSSLTMTTSARDN